MSNTHADLLSNLRNAFTTEGPAAALGMVMQHFEADGGTIHLLGEDGNLHLKANLPEMPPDLLKIISII
ncbi:MAG: hypothetical protein ACI82F_001261, partial [Planctomycetota bacterium]